MTARHPQAIRAGHVSRKKARGWIRARIALVSRTSSLPSFKKQRRTLHRVSDMSKTWKEEHRKHRTKHTEPTPQKAIDRLRVVEAQRDIREALQAPQEATK